MSDHYKKLSIIVFTHFKDAQSPGKEIYDEFYRHIAYEAYHNESIKDYDMKKKKNI